MRRCAAAQSWSCTASPVAGSAVSSGSSGSASATTTFQTSGTTEDAAILLAHTHQAELVVMVGSHASLVEFLDRGRSGMASSFLTRAAVGATVVDAKAVATALPQPGPRLAGVRRWSCSGSAAVAAAIGTTPVGQDWWHDIKEWLDDAYAWAKDRVS